MPTFPLRLTPEEHAAIKRRADAAGLSINKYIKTVSIDGKINTKVRKSTN